MVTLLNIQSSQQIYVVFFQKVYQFAMLNLNLAVGPSRKDLPYNSQMRK